jgi:arginyl-tRNA synthetase
VGENLCHSRRRGTVENELAQFVDPIKRDEICPVLKSEGAVRDSRLALCDLTARVLKQGLDVLGIETVEQM